MNCSRSRTRWLRFAPLGFAGALIAAGCGGSSGKKDGGIGDGGGDGGTGAVLKLSPTSTDFASVEINKTSAPVVFTLSNTGTAGSSAPMITVQGGDFAISPASTCAALPAAGSCMISVVFKPTSVGTKNGTLSVTAAQGGTVSASLTGQGATPGLNVNPSMHDFGPVAIGAMSDSFTITVSNTGAVAVGGLAVNLNGADFVAPMADNKCAGMMTLAPGASCTVGVQFKPASRGIKSGSLVASAGGQTVTSSLSGNGQAAPQLAINPTSAMLAGQVGKEGPASSFLIANVGDLATSAVSVALGGANAAEFKIATNGCLAPLGMGASCTVTVVTNPTSMGAKTATLTASAMSGGMAVAMLTSNVIVPGTLTITPPSANFQSVNVGSTSAATSFEVKNTGGATTAALNVSVTTGEYVVTANTCGGSTLAANATCNVSVAFKPSSMGTKTAILQVAGAGSELAQAQLSGNGVMAGLTVSPAAPNFGSVALNASSAPLTLTVTNTGGSASGALTATLGGASASQWAIMGNTCNGSIDPAATCTVTLVFTPTTMGDKTATLTVAGAGGGMAVANLSGAGLPAGTLTISTSPNPAFPVTADPGGLAPPTPPAPVSFTQGTVVGTTSPAVTVTILNPAGAAPTGKLSFMLTNVAAAEYTIGANNCPEAGLAAGNSCTLTLTFSPTSAGTRNASLIVTGASSGSNSGALQLTGYGRSRLEVVDLADGSASHNFGNQSVGVASANEAFAVWVRAPFAAVTPSASTHFEAGALGACLNAGNVGGATASVVSTNPATWLVCPLNADFKPADMSPAAKTGTLTVTGTGCVTATAALSGTAVGPLVVDPASGEYVNVIVNAPNTSGGVFVVTNNHPTNTFTPVTITLGGTDAGQFAITNNTCTTPVAAAGGTCTFTVTLTATSVGPKAATATVNATLNGSAMMFSQVVNLTGSATTTPGITVAPTTLTFGTTALYANSATQMITVTNPGSATVSITPQAIGGGEFTVVTNNCTNPLVQNATCTMLVRFNPTGTFIGGRTDTLTLSAGAGNTADVALVGTSSAPLTISPATDTFPVTTVGDATSAVRTYTVTNNSALSATALTTGLSDTTAANSDKTDFVVASNCVGPIAAGATCTATVRFVPNASGAATSSASLDVTGTISGNPFTASSLLTGTRKTAADLDFEFNDTDAAEAQNLGSTVTASGTIKFTRTVINNGQTTSGNLVLTIGGAEAADYSLDAAGTCGSVAMTTKTLAPGEKCTVVVAAAPSMAGNRVGTLTVTATGSGTTGVLTMTVIGVAGNVTITPNPADLGAGFTGTNPAAVHFTVNNASGTTLTTLAVATATGEFNHITNDTCSGNTFTNGQTCAFDVQFQPSMATAGYVRGTITLTETAGMTRTFTVGAFARRQVDATFTVSPDTFDALGAAAPFDFGSVVRESQSGAQTFTLTNVGERTSGAINVTKGGTDPTEFATSGTCMGATVAVGSSCTVIVRFTPAAPGGLGAKDATITATPATGNAAVINVVGTSVLTSLLTASVGGGTDFGSHQLAVDSTKTITIDNRANGQTTIPTATLTNTTDFKITGGSCLTSTGIDGAGPPTGQCDFVVAFDPQSVSASALVTTVNIASSSGSGATAVVLQGTSTSAITVDKAADTTLIGPGSSDTFTFTNALNANDTGALTVALSGTDKALFQITADTCTTAGHLPGTGALGTRQCTVTVSFVPGAAAAGAKTATLTVSGTVAGNNAASALTATQP